jgi:hydrogenase expression/formation protein HypC
MGSGRAGATVVTGITVRRITRAANAPRPGDIPTLRDEAEERDMCLAIPGQVIEVIDPVNQIAKVDVVGVRRNINVSLLAGEADPIGPGDWVLIHVGFAISRVDEEEARATRELLEQMGQEYEQELEELKASVIE